MRLSGASFHNLTFMAFLASLTIHHIIACLSCGLSAKINANRSEIIVINGESLRKSAFIGRGS